MPEIRLCPLVTQHFKSQTKPTESKPEYNSSNQPKFDKKKLAFSTMAAIGVVGLAFGIVHHKKNNLEQIQEPLQTFAGDFEKGVKKFFNNGNSINGVKLNKGRAINVDGSGFSGVMKTMNNKNEKITLEYVDGYVKKSTKNEKLFKTFDYSSLANGQKTVVIDTFDETGNSTNKIQQKFYDNGKIAKTIRPRATSGDIREKGNIILEFSKDGKMLSDIETRECMGIEKAIFYSKDGKTIERELKRKVSDLNNYSFYEETLFADGSPLRQKTCRYSIDFGFDVDINTDTFKQTMNTPDIIKLFKNGKPDKGIIAGRKDGAIFLKDLSDEKSLDDFRISKYYTEPSLTLSRYDAKTDTFKKLTLENNEWTNGESEKNISPFSKKELLQKADELDEAMRILKEDNIIVNQRGKEEGDFDLYPEKFTAHIQKIRNYATSL